MTKVHLQMYYLCQSFTCCAKKVVLLQCECLWHDMQNILPEFTEMSLWFLENSCINLISCMAAAFRLC